MTAAVPPSDRTTVRRKRDRARYDRTLIDEVLDEGLIAHVGFVAEHGPVVLPMVYARDGDAVYLHGAAANNLLRHLADGQPLCMTVTLVDGIVFARSAFHHSMNYRSVVLFGVAERVEDADEVRRASAALLEHIATGRSADARPPTGSEIRSTLVVRLPIDEVSAKVRTGGAIDDDADLSLPVWAGVLPLRVGAGNPIPDNDVPVPAYVAVSRYAPTGV